MPRASRRTARIHGDLLETQERLLRIADGEEDFAVLVPEVSAWGVGRHLEHLSRVDAAILDDLERALERGHGTGRGSPSPIGWLTLLVRWIPRGRARTPEPFRPEGADVARVRDGLRSNRQRFEALGPRLGELERLTGTEEHPVLGHLTARRWLCFLLVHDRHHAAIVDDILRRAGRGTRRTGHPTDDGGTRRPPDQGADLVLEETPGAVGRPIPRSIRGGSRRPD